MSRSHTVLRASGSLVVVGTCTGVDQVDFQFDVVPATNGGLTALPTTAVATNGSLITAGTGTSQLAVTSGNVTVGTNSDKSGYSLAASQTFSIPRLVGLATGPVGSVMGSVGSITGVTFPTNFSALAIASTTGQVGVDLTNIKQATTATTLTNITVPTVTTRCAVGQCRRLGRIGDRFDDIDDRLRDSLHAIPIAPD